MQVELITTLLERTIAYHPVFRDVAGSTAGAVFLSQVYYWSTGERIPSQRAGWFYKTGKEWQRETRLTRSEQERARRDLKKAGLLEEKRRGRPAKLFFRLNLNRLFECITHLAMSGGPSSGGRSGGAGRAQAPTHAEASGTVNPADHGPKMAVEPVIEKSFENAGLQDSACLSQGAETGLGADPVLSEKTYEISSLQNAALLVGGVQAGVCYQPGVPLGNAFNNSGLLSYPPLMLDSAFSVQNSAFKVLNPANSSAESCNLYTKITAESTSEITADAVSGVQSVPGGVCQANLQDGYQPTAADSSHLEEVVVQGWQSQNADSAERVQPASGITPDSSEIIPNVSQTASNPSRPFQADDATDQRPTGALARMPMSGDWLPDSDRLKRLCRMRGVSLKNLSPERYQDLLCEFRTYRVSEGLTLSQHKWEVKLVDQLLWYQRNRPEAFAGDLAGDQAGVSNLADRAQPFNRESRYGKSSSSASGRGKPRNSAERLAASCAGAFDYFQSQSGGQSQGGYQSQPAGQSQSQSLSAEQAGELPSVQRTEPECISAGSSVGIGTGALTENGIVTDSSTCTDTGTGSGGGPETRRVSTQGKGEIQPAASDTATGRSDAGFGVGQSSAAGEVSRAEGGEVRVVESCSGQARSGEVSVTGWRDEANGVLGGGVVNPPPTRFGDIWDNPSMWPVR